nr:UbiD family decarboxylase [Candidatus Sigynarchaeota archaeon]
MYRAIEKRTPPLSFDGDKAAPCQEVEEKASFLEKIPILKHLPGDGGRYITSGVAIYHCPIHGRNCSFHRMMSIGPDKMVARVVEDRGLDTALKASKGPLEAAIILGNSPQVMVAASTSAPKGVDELAIANTLSPFEVVKCKGIDIEVPVDSEIVIEGHFLKEQVNEGPFLDLTGTLDIVRKQPVFKVDRITHRMDPIYHALLPGGKEHQLLMGLPREATLLMELVKIGDAIKDVRLTPGSSHWFNAVVQVDRKKQIDPAMIFKACMDGHKSLKNCVIVDDDINIDEPVDVEYAIATRSQFN